MYISSLYQEPSTQSLPRDGVNTLLGNAADPSDNHVVDLEKLKSHPGKTIKIYSPLWYGIQEHAHKASVYGETHFGEQLIALRAFMSFNKHTEFLSPIDIAIFNQKRQQGMEKITTLLGVGKKAHLRKDVTTWKFQNALGFTVFDVELFDLSKIDKNISNENLTIARIYFSEANLVKQLNGIFQ